MMLFENLILGFFLFVYGTALGSFFNVLSDRLPRGQSILGRSHCEYCKHDLAWNDLFPLFSFLFLRGRCRYCHKKLSFYYPAVELVTGIAFVITWFFLPIPNLGAMDLWSRILYLIITSALIVIFFADLKFQIIPDSMQFILFVTAIFARIVAAHGNLHILPSVFLDGFTIMTPLLLIFLLTKGRGMGFGDVKLAFSIGMLFGIKGGGIILYLGIIFGALAGSYLLFTRKKKLRSKIAFGPFLVIAMVLVMFFHQPLYYLLWRYWGI